MIFLQLPDGKRYNVQKIPYGVYLGWDWSWIALKDFGVLCFKINKNDILTNA